MELAAASSATEIMATRTASRAEAAYLLLLIVREMGREGEVRQSGAGAEHLAFISEKEEGALLLSFARAAPNSALSVSYTCDVHTNEGVHMGPGGGGSNMAKLF